MKNLHRLFNDIWSCRGADYENLKSLVAGALLSGNVAGLSDIMSDEAPAVKMQAMLPGGGAAGAGITGGKVAVLKLSGFLYPFIPEKLIDVIGEMAEDETVAGLVLDIDGPGGSCSRIEQLANLIKNFGKPTATVVNGMMASAHFWIGTSTQRTFVASDLCEVGSVGVLQSFFSLRKYFESQGIIERDIYPDSADLKNSEFRALEDDGNEDPIKAKLAAYHRVFSDTVARNLGVDYDPELPLFRGATFMADEALKLGYLDTRGTVDDAVKWVYARYVSKLSNQLIS